MTNATLCPSKTNLPSFSKLTVTRPAMLDCTCPSPQSGALGLRTYMPGARIAVMSAADVSSDVMT